jgi:hypothetical protein
LHQEITNSPLYKNAVQFQELDGIFHSACSEAGISFILLDLPKYDRGDKDLTPKAVLALQSQLP